jgi:hypothetical protein
MAEQFTFTCDVVITQEGEVCGGSLVEQTIPGHYRCEKCGARYFFLKAPFDVLARDDKDKIAAGTLKAVCSETAAIRLMTYVDPHAYRLHIAVLQQRGCQDIHTIAPCINWWLKTNYYALYYLPLLDPTANVLVPTTRELTYRIMSYLSRIYQPLIVSILPTKNKEALLRSLRSELDYLQKLPEYLHSILIVGSRYNMGTDAPDMLYVHDQEPFEAYTPEYFSEAHKDAECRTLLTTWFEEVAGRHSFKKAGYRPWV